MQQKVRAEDAVDIEQEKVKVLKIKQNSDIQQNRKPQQRFSVPNTLYLSHTPSNGEIHQNRSDNNRQIAGVKIPIEPQGHQQKIPLCQMVLLKMVQAKVTGEAQWEKSQDKDIRIKKQGILPPLTKSHTATG